MIVFGRYHLDCFNNAAVPVICMTGALAAIKASRRRVFRTGTNQVGVFCDSPTERDFSRARPNYFAAVAHPSLHLKSCVFFFWFSF